MNKKRDTERVSSIFVVLNRRPFKLKGTIGARKTSSNVERDRKYNVKIIIIIIINQGTNARRCPMPFSLFDAIFVSPKQRGIVLVLMHHTSLLYCPSILYVVALFC